MTAMLTHPADEGSHSHKTTVMPVRRTAICAELNLDAEALVTCMEPLVRSIAYRMSGDIELRKDLICEGRLAVLVLRQRYDTSRGIPFMPYLVSQLRYHLYSYSRRHRAWRSRETELWDPTSARSNAYRLPNRRSYPAASDPTSVWIALIHRQQVLVVLRDLIGQLPDRQRRVLVWRSIDEVSYEEIAIRLDVQPATARSLHRHGVARLRKALSAFAACDQ